MAIKLEIRGEYFPQLANNENIFYCHVHDAVNFFKTPPKDKFVLITHNSDGCITWEPKRFNHGSSNDCDLNVIMIPNNLLKWYSQNVNVRHQKIESIPIGLENNCWFPDVKKYERIKEIAQRKKTYKNLLYVNHNIATNPPERTAPYKLFSNKKWATVEHGANGVNFNNYLENLHSHKFILCPEGNGIDTHRTWESLYIGSIPIEKRNFNNVFYEDLPICFVNKWEDITEEFLNCEYERILHEEWNLDKMYFDYWKNKITTES